MFFHLFNQALLFLHKEINTLLELTTVFNLTSREVEDINYPFSFCTLLVSLFWELKNNLFWDIALQEKQDNQSFCNKLTSCLSSFLLSFSCLVNSSMAFFLRSFFLLWKPRRYSLQIENENKIKYWPCSEIFHGCWNFNSVCKVSYFLILGNTCNHTNKDCVDV